MTSDITILHIVGTRRNFIKAAPVMQALDGLSDVVQILVHTGQHYDVNMSDVFFKELGMPQPNVDLEVGSGSHAFQTARIMMRLEEALLECRSDLVLVYGDVNSTVAAALVCAKLFIPVGHIEAGLRSFDRTMPEEINRLLTDQIADLLFTPSKDGNENLLNEGVSEEKIHYVGNVMIDTLLRFLSRGEIEELRNPEIQKLHSNETAYALVTLYRPSNVDDPKMLTDIIVTLGEISQDLPLIFPIHPRTKKKISNFGMQIAGNGRLKLIDQLGYFEFLALLKKATAVITDSGGVQEETT